MKNDSKSVTKTRESEMNEKINIELSNITNLSENETNIAKYIYLNMKRCSIENSFARVGSSREKDVETMKWRYVMNEATLMEIALLATKIKNLKKQITRMENRGRILKGKSTKFNSKLLDLKIALNEANLEYYRKSKEKDRVAVERKIIYAYDEINFDELNPTTNNLAKEIEKLEGVQKQRFWLSYFKAADDYMINLDSNKSFATGAMEN